MKIPSNPYGRAVLVVLAVAVLAAAAVISSPYPPAAGEHAIKVAYLPATQSLPLFVAQERGLFEQAGLQVEMERIESPNQIIDALITGKADAGAPSVAAGIAAIAELKNPGALKIYSLTCGTKDRLNDELLVRKDSGITSIRELEGKKLGHIPGVQFSTMARKILMENNVDPARVTLVELPIPNQLPALAAGGVDAVLTLEPTATIGEQKGISRILVRNPMVQYVADPWCGAAGVVSARFLEEQPEEAGKFVNVMNEAIDITRNDPSARQYLVQYLNLPEEVADEVPLPLMVTTEEISPDIENAYQQFADVFYELGVTEARVDVGNLFLG